MSSSNFQFVESFTTENLPRSALSGPTEYSDRSNGLLMRAGAKSSLNNLSSLSLSTTTSAYSANASVRRIAQDLLKLERSASIKNLPAITKPSNYLSKVETAILRSSDPIEMNETEEISILGERGIWLNKSEVTNWKGTVPISDYKINEDKNPEIVTKRTVQHLEYVQELAIRYLRPPTPPAPGEIVVTQEPNIVIPPAPPLVIRQQPPRPDTPEPLVIREAPPQPPAQVGRKVITISGQRLPPPPRKVVIERLAPLPSKPQSAIIERWLPYSEVKRRVIFNKPTIPDPIIVKPRNIIVQWEAPQVIIKKDLKYLGVIRANPAEYVQRYSSSLKLASDLPDFVLNIKTPKGIVLAADKKTNTPHELEGDIQALKLVDLDKEGLSEYKPFLHNLGVLERQSSAGSTISMSSRLSESNLNNSIESIVERIFRSVDSKGTGRVTVEDAEKLLLKLNSRLGRRYGEDDVKAFFNALDVNNDASLDLNQFKKAFLNIS